MKNETPIAKTFTAQFMIDLWKPAFDSRFKRAKVVADKNVTAYIESLPAVVKEQFVEELLELSIDWQLNSDQRSDLLMTGAFGSSSYSLRRRTNNASREPSRICSTE
jgi:hypothetical protein